MDIVWCVFTLLWSMRQCFRVIWSISCTVIRKGVLALYNIPFCLRRCFATTMAIPGRKMCSYMAAAWRRPFSNLTSTHRPLTCRRTVDIGWSHVYAHAHPHTHSHTYLHTQALFYKHDDIGLKPSTLNFARHGKRVFSLCSPVRLFSSRSGCRLSLLWG